MHIYLPGDGLMMNDTNFDEEYDNGDIRRGLDGIELSRDYLTCEWVFRSKSRILDYHGNMDGDFFLNWVEHQLIPTFKAKYGDEKKLILVLDNAPYHHTWTMGQVNLKGTKIGLVAAAKKHKLKGFYVDRKDFTGAYKSLYIKPANFSKRAHAGGSANSGPYAEELAVKPKVHLLEKDPTALHDDLRVLFSKYNFDCIFTPPYCPQYQPIELMWAKCKGEVAVGWHLGRTIHQLYACLMKSWYGGPGRTHLHHYEKINREMCGKWILKSEKKMDAYIKEYSAKLDGEVTGT